MAAQFWANLPNAERPPASRARRRPLRSRYGPRRPMGLYDHSKGQARARDVARPSTASAAAAARRGPFRRCPNSEVVGSCSQLIEGLRPPIERCLATDTARPPYFYLRVDLLL